MHQKLGFIYKIAAFVLISVLLVSALMACGDDDKEEPGTTPAATPTPPVSDEPVKIGVLTSWSGAGARGGQIVDQILKIVDKQLEERGGLNVGGVMRPVKWVKQDDMTQVADSIAGYKKLALQGVSAVLVGGASAACLTATSDAAEEGKVPFFSVGSTPVDLSNRPYTIRCAYPNATDNGPMVLNFALREFKPKTAGFIMVNMDDIRARGSLMKKMLEAAGVNVVYEQYPEVSTVDFSPLLTAIRQKNPDVLFGAGGGTDAFYMNIFKQMPELGGWGDIKFISTDSSSSGPALKEKGSEGTYHWLLWMPGLPYPGSKEFEDIWTAQYSERPTSGHFIMYQTIWVGLKSIEMAGSDKPADIQKAARSGNFVWENAPAGPFKINANGTHNGVGLLAYYKDGKLVPLVGQ
ncbi:MAG: ABC transporter substrate-binding protein [Dehalococcoidia bacterium]|nr:ABC transporter substrate-binding protein [Dehalococcoidia bacterium]